MTYPNKIKIGHHMGGHIQGIAIDEKNGFIYCSFTTELVKYTLNGEFVGSVKGLTGHLGCLSFSPDGKVFGSLEYKNDAIGKGILARAGDNAEKVSANAFYAAIFDGKKITAPDMDALRDGIMKTVYLRDVVEDYEYLSPNKIPHKYGCSGIDGNTFAPLAGENSDKLYWHVAYGIYGDVSRDDNDYQVILAYDVSDWDDIALPLDQRAIHRVGPDKPKVRYFIHTGNTTYGVQNLEYDFDTREMYMAVYRGSKESYPNAPMYVADWAEFPSLTEIKTAENSEKIDVVPLAKVENRDDKTGICYLNFPYGSTGLISLGDGKFYVSHETHDENGYSSEIMLYERDKTRLDGFRRI